MTFRDDMIKVTESNLESVVKKDLAEALSEKIVDDIFVEMNKLLNKMIEGNENDAFGLWGQGWGDAVHHLKQRLK